MKIVAEKARSRARAKNTTGTNGADAIESFDTAIAAVRAKGFVADPLDLIDDVPKKLRGVIGDLMTEGLYGDRWGEGVSPAVVRRACTRLATLHNAVDAAIDQLRIINAELDARGR
jgi:hypothetical protein